MIPNETLDNFLNDPDALSKTMLQIKASEKKLSKSPLLKKLNSYFKNNTSLNVKQLMPEVKKTIASETNSTIHEILDELHNESLKDSFYTFPVTGHSSDFTQNSILESNEYFDLSINVLNKHNLDKYKRDSYKNLEQRGIGFYGKHQLTYFLEAGDLEVTTWEFPITKENESKNLDLINLKCSKKKNEQFKSGQFVYFRPNQTMMFERADKNVIMLVLEFKQDVFPLSLMFSAKDFKLKYQNPTFTEHSRIQLFCTLLRHFDYQPSIEILKKLLDHELHFIRWHAMQELLGLNAISVMEELNTMSKSDEHEQVRVAALQTLEMINKIEIAHAY